MDFPLVELGGRSPSANSLVEEIPGLICDGFPSGMVWDVLILLLPS